MEGINYYRSKLYYVNDTILHVVSKSITWILCDQYGRTATQNCAAMAEDRRYSTGSGK